jgi:hypothetical protein
MKAPQDKTEGPRDYIRGIIYTPAIITIEIVPSLSDTRRMLLVQAESKFSCVGRRSDTVNYQTSHPTRYPIVDLKRNTVYSVISRKLSESITPAICMDSHIEEFIDTNNESNWSKHLCEIQKTEFIYRGIKFIDIHSLIDGLSAKNILHKMRDDLVGFAGKWMIPQTHLLGVKIPPRDELGEDYVQVTIPARDTSPIQHHSV